MGDILPTPPPGFDDLSVQDQISYVEFLWERISSDVGRVPVPKWHHRVIEERLAEFETDPDAGRPWEEVRAEFRERLTQGR